MKLPDAAPLIGPQRVLSVGSFQMHQKKRKTTGELIVAVDGNPSATAWLANRALASPNLHKNKKNLPNPESRSEFWSSHLWATPKQHPQMHPNSRTRVGFDPPFPPKKNLLQLWWRRKILARVFEIRLRAFMPRFRTPRNPQEV